MPPRAAQGRPELRPSKRSALLQGAKMLYLGFGHAVCVGDLKVEEQEPEQVPYALVESMGRGDMVIIEKYIKSYLTSVDQR